MEKPTYYILRSNEPEGPFTFSQLCAKWSAGDLPKETLYSEEGYSKWLQLRILMEEDESARATLDELLKTSTRAQSNYVARPHWVHRMESTGGVLEVFEDKLTIEAHGVLGLLAKGLKGTKMIPFFSITAIQLKRAGLTNGYIQFTIPGGNESRGGLFDAAADENTFMFGDKGENNRFAEIIKEYIEGRIKEIRSPGRMESKNSAGIADELKKLAELKSQGMLSEGEFLAAKNRLLAG